MMKTITVAASLIGLSRAAGFDGPFDYKELGSDWPGLPNAEDCAKPGQSPIDLKTDFSIAGYVQHDIALDQFTRDYTNQKDVEILWDGHTSKISVLGTGPNSFTSELGKTLFSAESNKFDAQQFHFHHKSEHEINGIPQDLEMHTVHYLNPQDAADKFVAAAVGIMFSVKDYTIKLSRAEELVIDTFFETMDWQKDTSDPTVNLVTYGDLMNMVDFNNRWIYKGSVTTPPCAQDVYWNVLHTVYPIKQKHLDLFKKQLAREKGYNLNQKGNRRIVQPITTQNVAVVTETVLGADKDSANDINYNININIYNQNVGSGQCA